MERLLFLLKPAILPEADKIVYKLEQNGFHILEKSQIRLTAEQIKNLFFNEEEEIQEAFLNEYLSGDIVVLILEKLSGFQEIKNLLGQADVETAKEFTPNSLRAIYGDLFYASLDFPQAERDIRFFFPDAYVDTFPAPNCDKSFLENSIYPVLTEGLTYLCKEKPENPIKFLGDWLLENNPNVPKIKEPSTAA
ncbi:NME NM23 member 5 [Clydaea vesicula]|uniref:Nucleoside diphosphate kinase n=1 Tax=Clydaea vesicula TaxID=447962 RepID=A0AAD5XXI0_9FUNG|nr:NME NM23 member 5 [Clydaea vesicula]KAJ3381015.1 NME NM23 member 5 [Lobulomyces angularis]